VFLTTHYMEDADHLCDRVATIDHGRIVALGTPAALKSSVGGDLITIRLAGPAAPELAAELAHLPRVEALQPGTDGTFNLIVREGERTIPVLLDFLSSRGHK